MQNKQLIIPTIKRNWCNIQRVMLLSQKSELNWVQYSQRISNGLSNNILTKQGCEDFSWFVQRLPDYAKLSDEYLTFAKKLPNDQIDFIRDNRDFLLNIN